MRLLTVQQPWAWAIVHGGKTVENRTQLWSYRGPLAIHAGKRVSERGLKSPLIGQALRDAGHVVPESIKHPILVNDFGHVWGAKIHLGAVIGVVDLVDVHPSIECCDLAGAYCSPWAEASYHEHGGRKRVDVLHLVLEYPRPIDPVPAKGRLGLWHDVDLLAEVRRRLEVANA